MIELKSGENTSELKCIVTCILQGMEDEVGQYLVGRPPLPLCFWWQEPDSCWHGEGLAQGPGIYHNKEKTFLTLVNKEDKLKIISMQQGQYNLLIFFTHLSLTEIQV